MRKRAALLLCLLSGLAAAAQPQYIASGKFSSSANMAGSPQSLASAIDSTGATHGLLCAIVYNTTAPTAVTDTKSNTWTLQSTGLTVNSAPGTMFCYTSTLTSVGSGHNFSVTPAGNFGLTFLVILAGPSAGGTVTISQNWVVPTSANTDSTSPHTSPSVTVPSGGALLFSCGSYDAAGGAGTFNWSGSSFTEQVFEKGAGLWLMSCASRVESTPGSTTASFTSSGTPAAGGIGVIMLTEAAGGGGSTAVPVFTHHYLQQTAQ